MDNFFRFSKEVDVAIAGTLYGSIVPCGVGTSQTESLGSYIHRLAQAHCVESVELVRYLLSAYGLNLKNGVSFYSQGLNGEQGRIPLLPLFVHALAVSTGRSDLHGLSMDKWTNVLSLNHMHREHLAWCPLCIQEQIGADETIYEPLLWTFNALDHCMKHHVPLVSRCGLCGHRPRYFDRGGVIGYCSNCCTCLSNVNTEVSDLNDKTVYESILDLILASLEMKNSPNHSCIPEAVKLYREHYLKGNGVELARRIGVGQTVLIDKYLNKHLPSLTLSSQLATFFGVPLHQLLNNRYLGEVLTLIKTTNSIQEEKNVVASRKVDWSKPMVEEKLLSFLTNNPPLSLTKVASNLGYTRRRLSIKFPDICEQISTRYRNYCIEQKGFYPGEHLIHHTSTEENQIILKEFTRLLEEQDPPETLDMIAAKLGKCKATLNREFPEICRRVKEKYRIHYKENRVIKGRFGTFKLKELEQIINSKLQDEKNQQSTNEIVKELGLKQRVLKETFPKQYSEITTRYNALKERTFKEKMDDSVTQLREAILELHTLGLYPSTTKVCEKLGYNPYWKKNLYKVWRGMLIELGYQTEM